MRFQIAIDINADRISARRADGTVEFDEPAVVSLKPDAKGRPVIAGIGSDQPDRESTQVVPVVSRIQFQPGIVAAVALYIVHKAWASWRPGLSTPLMLFDHVDARITVDDVAPDAPGALMKTLPFRRDITWWVNGEKVKF